MGYLGAKSGSGVYQKIINLMPPHDVYVEAFLGTGAIMKRKAPAMKNIGIDKSASCIEKFEHDGVEAFVADAFEFLPSLDLSNGERTLIYCDPPYVKQTRTSQARYEHEFSDDDHRRLLVLLKTLPCNVIISGYYSELYNDLLGDWWKTDFPAMTRGGVRTEVVWCNFEPSDVHWHRYAGKNATDRQRIKRKAERWAASYAKLPNAERQAVMAALLAVK